MYESLAPFYDAIRTETADIPFWKRVTSQAQIVLELGTGTGRVAREITRNDMKVIGIDASPHMLFRGSPWRDGPFVAAANALRLPFRCSFDVHIAPMCLFMELHDPGACLDVLRECRARSHASSTLIVTTNNPLRAFRPSEWCREITCGEASYVLRERLMVGNDRCARSSRTVEDAQGRIVAHVSIPIRWYVKGELEAHAKTAGWRVAEQVGSYDGAQLSEESTICITSFRAVEL